jgi:hypothetical protein
MYSRSGEFSAMRSTIFAIPRNRESGSLSTIFSLFSVTLSSEEIERLRAEAVSEVKQRFPAGSI